MCSAPSPTALRFVSFCVLSKILNDVLIKFCSVCCRTRVVRPWYFSLAVKTRLPVSTIKLDSRDSVILAMVLLLITLTDGWRWALTAIRSLSVIGKLICRQLVPGFQSSINSQFPFHSSFLFPPFSPPS